MNDYKDLEEANKEVERSKSSLHETDKPGDKNDQQNQENNSDDNNMKQEGSGIFTADGEELPDIEGGYDIVEPGGTLGDDEFVSE